MAYEKLKSLTRSVGIYGMARRIYRYIWNRDALRAFREEMVFFRQFLRPGCLCFDVGANYGAKAEVFLKLGAKVVAFEPQRDCLEELRSRLSPGAHLVTINAAVGSHVGHATLFTHRHRTCSSMLMDWGGATEDTLDVPMTTLDDAIAKYGVPEYCKIDVEGFELEVLKGLNQRIPILSFEYHLQKDGLTKAMACLDHLARFGELLVNITPAEKPAFGQSKWLGKCEFVNFFQGEVPRMSGYHYGDIFVKITEPLV